MKILINMKTIKQFINEELNKYFTEEEKGKIMKDMWDKNGKSEEYLNKNLTLVGKGADFTYEKAQSYIK